MVFHRQTGLPFSFDEKEDDTISFIVRVLSFLSCVAHGLLRDMSYGISKGGPVVLYFNLNQRICNVMFTGFHEVFC